MEIIDLINPESVIVNLKVTSKKQALQELSKKIGALVDKEERVIFDLLLEREKLGTTGIGDGIAIPHGKSDAVSQLAAALGTQRRGVDFEALDGEPAFVFFLLVSPAKVSGPHIKALARISRLLKNDDFKKKLTAATTPAEVLSVIEAEEQNHPSSD